jgi:excisionase family DNA binding protein
VKEDLVRALKVEDVAERLQVDTKTVYRLIRSGELKARQVGRLYRISVRALDDYLMGREDYDAEPLNPEELDAVARALADIQAGRTVSWGQMKREHGL